MVQVTRLEYPSKLKKKKVVLGDAFKVIIVTLVLEIAKF